MNIKHLLYNTNSRQSTLVANYKTSQSSFSRVRYEFRFSSLIAPGSNLEAQQDRSVVHSNRNGFKRLLLKRSYLVLSWFYYLSLREFQESPKSKSLSAVRLAILPPKQNMYTLTKAPMAHKTNSKEQFLIKYYNFKFSVTLRVPNHLVSSSISEGAYALNLVREDFPVFETNLLFLKYAKVVLPCRDVLFFQRLV